MNSLGRCGRLGEAQGAVEKKVAGGSTGRMVAGQGAGEEVARDDVHRGGMGEKNGQGEALLLLLLK